MSFGDFETILSDTAVNYKNKSKNQYYWLLLKKNYIKILKNQSMTSEFLGKLMKNEKWIKKMFFVL